MDLASTSGIIEAVAKGVERVGIPGGLIFAGLYLLHRMATGVGPSIARFFENLAAKLGEHSVDHAKINGKLDEHHAQLEGKIDTHHEKTAAELRRTAAAVRASADSVRSDVLKAIDASTDRILDRVVDKVAAFPGRESSLTPVSGLQRTPRASGDDDDTQLSEKDR